MPAKKTTPVKKKKFGVRIRGKYTKQERELINPYKAQYLKATSPEERQSIAMNFIFTDLFTHWTMELQGKQMSPEEANNRAADLAHWVRNNWRPPKTRKEGRPMVVVRKADLVYEKKKQAVHDEICRLLGNPDADTLTEGWFRTRTTAVRNVMNTMDLAEDREYDEEVARIGREGYDPEKKKVMAEKHSTHRLDSFARENWLEMGLVSFSVVAYLGTDNQLGVEIHDNSQKVVGVQLAQTFQSRVHGKLEDIRRLWLEYVRELLNAKGGHCNKGAIPKPTTLADSSTLQYSETGFPRLPRDLQVDELNKKEGVSLLRRYLSKNYFLATYKCSDQVPYTSISKSASSQDTYIDPVYLPPGFKLIDPQNLNLTNIKAFFTQIAQRERDVPPHQVFRFNKVKSCAKLADATRTYYPDEIDPENPPQLKPKRQKKKAPPRTTDAALHTEDGSSAALVSAGTVHPAATGQATVFPNAGQDQLMGIVTHERDLSPFTGHISPSQPSTYMGVMALSNHMSSQGTMPLGQPSSLAVIAQPTSNPQPASMDAIAQLTSNPQPAFMGAVAQPTSNPQPAFMGAVTQPTSNPQPAFMAAVAQPTSNPQPAFMGAVAQPTSNLQPASMAAVAQPTSNPQPAFMAAIPQPTSNPQPAFMAAVPQPTSNPQPASMAAIPQPTSNPQPASMATGHDIHSDLLEFMNMTGIRDLALHGLSVGTGEQTSVSLPNNDHQYWPDASTRLFPYCGGIEAGTNSIPNADWNSDMLNGFDHHRFDEIHRPDTDMNAMLPFNSESNIPSFHPNMRPLDPLFNISNHAYPILGNILPSGADAAPNHHTAGNHMASIPRSFNESSNQSSSRDDPQFFFDDAQVNRLSDQVHGKQNYAPEEPKPRNNLKRPREQDENDSQHINYTTEQDISRHRRTADDLALAEATIISSKRARRVRVRE